MLQFKTQRIRDEYAQLPTKNPKLFELLIALEYYTRDTFKKDVVITSILRTKEENDALYVNTPVDKRPKSQPHCDWKAADIRSTIYTEQEIRFMLDYLNKRYPNTNGKPAALYHTIAGGAPHFHLAQF